MLPFAHLATNVITALVLSILNNPIEIKRTQAVANVFTVVSSSRSSIFAGLPARLLSLPFAQASALLFYQTIFRSIALFTGAADRPR